MLFMLKIVVRLPGDLPPEKLAEINKRETARSMQMVREGKLKRIFRIAGRRANFSIWEVASPEELHATLTAMPLHPYMDIEVTPIIKHTTTEAWEKEVGEMPAFQ
jgi:muconolactone D-isomerase